ncbi:MAG: hypothetical protein R2747_18105 [Pyrinomonadaceae bacterium]
MFTTKEFNDRFSGEKNKSLNQEELVSVLIAFLLLSTLILFSLGLAGAYFWADIKNPSANEHSVPAPRTY